MSFSHLALNHPCSEDWKMSKISQWKLRDLTLVLHKESLTPVFYFLFILIYWKGLYRKVIYCSTLFYSLAFMTILSWIDAYKVNTAMSYLETSSLFPFHLVYISIYLSIYSIDIYNIYPKRILHWWKEHSLWSINWMSNTDKLFPI